MKRVRMLLRVSSNQQLETDGDLSIQRQLVKEYIEKQSGWKLDDTEYFEGSNSGYKNAVTNRDTLQKALKDAKNHEYDILVAYKDDRIGRRMWEIGAYIMTLKSVGVDIYTVKDGCISPENDDIMGQMMLALRYGNAQKSSSDTGMRVRDTAQKLVQKGKFMGGSAPYGYVLVLSGEISKHGRALHTLQILPQQAEVVKHIYHLSLYKEYGSTRIAKELNQNEYYQALAPNNLWKSGTITSILTNPIYAGYTAYKRREHINGKYHRLDSSNWIIADKPEEALKIIEKDIWNQTQDKRKQRSIKYAQHPHAHDTTVIPENTGILPLIDVIYCGYCGRKLTNGTKYSYWTIKNTGEKRSSKTPIYRCPSAQQGIPHNTVTQFHAAHIEPLVLDALAKCIGKLLKNEDILTEIRVNLTQEKKSLETDLKKQEKEWNKTMQGIEIMENHIPNAMTGSYPLSIEELAAALSRQKVLAQEQKKLIAEKKEHLKRTYTQNTPFKNAKIPTWQQLFWEADTQTQHILVNRLIGRIDVTKERLIIHFKINPKPFLPRMNDDSPTTPYTHDLM